MGLNGSNPGDTLVVAWQPACKLRVRVDMHVELKIRLAPVAASMHPLPMHELEF
jgi:hypothetical protein